MPPNAVVEIAVRNTAVSAEHAAGVRAVGSGLERRFLLHEPEGLGADCVVMHVQIDGSSQIAHYASDIREIHFTLPWPHQG